MLIAFRRTLSCLLPILFGGVICFGQSTYPGGNPVISPASFDARVSVTSSYGGTQAVIVMDLDGDGLPDVVTGSRNGSTISLFHNMSTKASVVFGPELTYSGMYGPDGMAAADLDGDGKPDIVVGNYGEGILTIFQNTSTPGTLSFVKLGTIFNPYNCSHVSIADLDGDGKPDIVSVGTPGPSDTAVIAILRNQSTPGSISFSAVLSITLPGFPGPLAVKDIDGDGKPDLAVSCYDSQVDSLLFFQNTSTPGNFAFTGIPGFGRGNYATDLTFADLDGDGRPDMVAATGNTSASLWPNISSPGTIAFGTKLLLPTAGALSSALTVADIDGDGIPDLAVANRNTNSSANGLVSILRNTSTPGNFIFSAHADITVDPNPWAMAAADIDGDGKTDLITGNWGTVPGSVLRNRDNEPSIFSFAPIAAFPGDTVTLKGVNLTGTDTVSFGGVTAAGFRVVSDSVVKAVVGSGSSGSVSLKTGYGQFALAGFEWDSLLPPVITTLSPASGPVGTKVTISGAHFATTPAGNAVWFGAVRATVTAASASSLTVSVPAGASYKPVSVTANRLTGYSEVPFSVTFGGVVNAFTPTSFAQPIQYANTDPFGSLPMDLVFADFDGDGRPDAIELGMQAESGFVVCANTGKPNAALFAPQPAIDWLIGPKSIAVGDIDGDGLPDVALAGDDNYGIIILKNTGVPGTISFANVAHIPGSYFQSVSKVVLGDIDADGKPDLLALSNNRILVYRNTSVNGALSFADSIGYAVGAGPVTLAVADLDGDGRPELITANATDNTITVLRNTSTASAISFAPALSYPAGANPADLTIADLDNDGKLDIAVSDAGQYPNYATTITLFRNTSAGSLSLVAAGTASVLRDPGKISAGDLDGDGKPELLVACSADSVAILPNKSTTGSFAFGAPVYYQTNGYPQAVLTGGDLDGDGYPDIAFWSSPAKGFSIMKSQVNVSATSFIPPVITAVTPDSAVAGSTVTITGQNFGPGASDNIVGFGTVTATVTLASAGSLKVTVPKSASYAPVTVTRGGLTATSTKWFDRTFVHSAALFSDQFLASRVDTLTGSTSAEVAIGDLNGDGQPELVTSNIGSGTVSIYPNTGRGGAYPFGTPLSYSVPYLNGGALLFDVDGDGKVDIVVFSAVNSAITILINTSVGGTISFAAPVGIPNTPGITGAVVGDFDGDGRLDLAATGNTGSISIMRNMTANGVVDFALVATIPLYESPGGVAVGDFDGDGKPDLVVTHGSGSVSVFFDRYSVNNYSFSSPLTYTTGSQPMGVVVADLDGDGRLDFAVANYFDNIISLYLNGGTSFTRTDYSANTAYGPQHIVAGDLNGDGLPDLVIDNYYDSVVYLLKNTSSPGSLSFAPKATYASRNTPVQTVIGDWNGDGLPDLALASNNPGVLSLYANQSERPVITGFSPTVVSPGTVLTVTGYNFTTTQSVNIGGVPATAFSVVSDQQLSVTVGEGWEDDVAVTTDFGKDSLSGLRFAAPVINTVSPVAGPVGTTVQIAGNHFSAVATNDRVFFGAAQGKVTAASVASLSVQAPAGASLQPITLSLFGEMTAANLGFDIKFPAISNGFTADNFAPKMSIPAGVSPMAVAAADLDGDGLVDVVVGNMILRNTGGPGLLSFAAAQTYGNPGSPTPAMIALEDINGDGKPDLIEVGYEAAMIGVFVNTSVPGSISFAPEADFACDFDAVRFSLADLDGDGKKDIVVVSDFEGDVTVLRNISHGSVVSFAYDNSSTELGGYYGQALAVRDLDGDGKPDVVTANARVQNITVFRNTSVPGTISFAVVGPLFTTDGNPNSIVAADLDGDGKVDLAVNEWPLLGGSAVLVYRNIGSPGNCAFVLQNRLALSGSSSCLAIGDWDGDGKPDIAAPEDDFGGAIAVFKNAFAGGSLAFNLPVDYTADYQPASVLAADLDGDGKPEIVTVSNTSTGTVAVLRNQQGEARVQPNGAAPVTGAIVNQMAVDSTVETLNGSPYVPRHYDIQPVVNASGATALVTLYFTQNDFNLFNAYPNHGPDLPKAPNDIQGIADLRIYQYHGFSATGQPGSYSGNGVVIDPADSNIVWNATDQWWEVSFEVDGFSGFFVSSIGFNYNQTPAPAISLQGAAEFCQGGNTTLVSSWPDSSQWYLRGVAIPGATGASYQAALAGVYTVTATNNGIVSPPSAGVTVRVDTAAATPVITLSGTNLQSSVAGGNQWYLEGVAIPGATGASYQPTVEGHYTVTAVSGTCPAVTSAQYYYQVGALIRIDDQHYITAGPNPFRNTVLLRYSIAGGSMLTARVSDAQGRVCFSTGPLADGASLDLSSLAGGVYMVELLTLDGKQHYVIKLLKGN